MLRRRWRWGFLHAVPAGRRGTSAARSFRTPGELVGWLLAAPQHRGVLRAAGCRSVHSTVRN